MGELIVLFHAFILNFQLTILCTVHLTWHFIVMNGVKNSPRDGQNGENGGVQLGVLLCFLVRNKIDSMLARQQCLGPQT